MKDIIPGKTSAQLPDELGHYGSRPANTAITVLLIGTRSNHPLGLLAPGMKESGAHFAALAKDLEDQAENFGFLGMTSWLSMSTRNTSSEIQYVYVYIVASKRNGLSRNPTGLSTPRHLLTLLSVATSAMCRVYTPSATINCTEKRGIGGTQTTRSTLIFRFTMRRMMSRREMYALPHHPCPQVRDYH